MSRLKTTVVPVVYVSPGIGLQLRSKLQMFGFVQRPVFSRLDGYQVFPHWTGSLGVSYEF
jgi:hypothetical protein